MAGAGRIDAWKVEEVLRYLGKAFPGCRLSDYPRGGGAAHLFTVVQPSFDARRQQRHNLNITRQFFDRCPDASTLRDALDGVDVAHSLQRVGDRTLDLY